MRFITLVNKRSWLGRSYKPKLKPAGPCIALYLHQTAFFYMCECVTHGTNLNVHILFQYRFSTFFNTYLTHLLSFFLFRGLVSEYWLQQIQTSVSPLNHRKLFIFFAHRKLTLNYAVSIFHTHPPIKSSVSPRALI